MKLRIVPAEASTLQEIFDWADMGRGGRWIVKTLNDRGTTLRGAKFSNSNLAGILARGMDDDGDVPEPEDWIAVPCPVIIGRDQLERVAALRASRNPRKTAPHISAGTTMLMGIAKCGMPDCTCGMTVRSGKGGQYHYYVCNGRVNQGRTCEGPSIRREQLDGVVLNAVERQLLAPARLQALLADVVNLSDQKRVQHEQELAHARAEQTRLRTAIDRLLVLVETGQMGPRDPIFASRMSENRTTLAAASTRIDTLETQLSRGSRKITAETVDRFGALLSAKLRDDDPTLRTAYLRMLVSDVTVSTDEILIYGPKATLENGVASGVPRLEGSVPIFDRKWCATQSSANPSLPAVSHRDNNIMGFFANQYLFGSVPADQSRVFRDLSRRFPFAGSKGTALHVDAMMRRQDGINVASYPPLSFLIGWPVSSREESRIAVCPA